MPLELLHNRLGNISFKTETFFSLWCFFYTSFVCDTCHLAKSHLLPFLSCNSISFYCFELIYADLWGFYNIPFILGTKYFLTIVDNKSKHTWTYLFQYKHQTSTILDNVFPHVHNHFNTIPKFIRIDNGSEFLSLTTLQ